MKSLLSFLPLIGVFVAERFSTPMTHVGAKISAYGTALLLLEYIFLRGENLLTITVFFIIILVVTVGVFLVSHRSIAFLDAFQILPSLQNIHVFFKTLPAYIYDIFLGVIGQKTEL